MLEKNDLLQMLKLNNIEFSVKVHAPLFTVEDSKSFRGEIKGGHSKNLFLKDSKDSFFLLSIEENISLDLKKISEPLNSKKLSFANSKYLKSIMGIEPGSVSPFALINDQEKKIKFFLDQSLASKDIVNFHPLINTATVSIKSNDLIQFIGGIHNPVNILNVENYQR